MTFFERYFERLDGPKACSSLDLVAEDVEFSIQWATGADRRSSEFLGGLQQLRGFIDAGDMEGWAHYVMFERQRTATSSSPSASRAGRRRGAASARSSPWRSSTPSGRCAATWSPARPPWPSRPARQRRAMLDQRDFTPVADGLIAGTADEPRLIGSACRSCGTVDLPRQASCPRCTSGGHGRSDGSAAAARYGPGPSSAFRPSRRPTPYRRARTSSATASATSSCPGELPCRGAPDRERPGAAGASECPWS